MLGVRFIMRTIRNGTVKVNNINYAPEALYQKYDGRLDGKRFAFGTYKTITTGQISHLALWGSEAYYRDKERKLPWPGEECVDNAFPWYWWMPVRKEVTAID